MDATRKAMFRSRMRQAAERKEKRIDSPLVRYNDLGQPVCKVCNVSVKSEALWGAHLASRQHKEAAEDLKERAKRQNEAAAAETRKNEEAAGSENKALQPDHNVESDEAKDGALPQGFFDNKDADSKARGQQPQKIDLQEELKEFQKLIEDDVKAVDERFADDEAEEAEIRTEEEEVEQIFCMDRVETLKRRKIALEETKPKAAATPVEAKDIDKLLDGLSSEDDSDEDLIMDWRAKQL